MGRVRLVRGTVVLLGVAVLLFVCAVAPSPGACLSVTDPGWEDVDVNALSDEELALLLGDLTDHGEEEPEDDDEDDADDEDDDDSRDRDALAMTEELKKVLLSKGASEMAKGILGMGGDTHELMVTALHELGEPAESAPVPAFEPLSARDTMDEAVNDHSRMIDYKGRMLNRFAGPVDMVRVRAEEMERRETEARVSRGEVPPPKGHGRPLGEHAEPAAEVEEYVYDPERPESLPTAREFWERHVYGYRPAVFRGLTVRSPAHDLWDEAYLRSRFGNLTVMFERREENRKKKYSKEPAPMRIDDLVGNYTRADIYAISCAPHSMLDDVEIPPFMMGGRRSPGTVSNERRPGWVTPVNEVGLWLSRNRTRSQAHRDQPGILNCAYGARVPDKEWLMFDTRRWAHWIPGESDNFDRSNPAATTTSDYSDFDPASADFLSHPMFAKIPYLHTTQRAGDCVFIPSKFYHQVTKDRDEFHAAVSYMVEDSVVMDERHVDDVPRDFFVPARLVDHAWYFAGTGVVPIGYLSPLQGCSALWYALRGAAHWGALTKLPNKARYSPIPKSRWLRVPGPIAGDEKAAGGGGPACSEDGSCSGGDVDDDGATRGAEEELDDFAIDLDTLVLFLMSYMGADDDLSMDEVRSWFERARRSNPPGVPDGLLAVSVVYRYDYHECQDVSVALVYDEPHSGVPYVNKPSWEAERDERDFYALLEAHLAKPGKV